MAFDLLYGLIYPSVIGTMLYDFLPVTLFPLLHGTIASGFLPTCAKAFLILQFTNDYMYTKRVVEKVEWNLLLPIVDFLIIGTIRYAYWALEDKNTIRISDLVVSLLVVHLLYLIWNIKTCREYAVSKLDWTFCIAGSILFGLLWLASLVSWVRANQLLICTVILFAESSAGMLLNFFIRPPTDRK